MSWRITCLSKCYFKREYFDLRWAKNEDGYTICGICRVKLGCRAICETYFWTKYHEDHSVCSCRTKFVVTIKQAFKITIKKNNGFKSIYELVYFLINCLLQIKSKIRSFCFCEEYKNGRKCELCLINSDFNDFEDIIKVKIIDRDFLLDYHRKLIPYLCKLFYAKKLKSVVFLMTSTPTQHDYYHTVPLKCFMSKI